ncbi:helix-turn-helix domain-containing protein [Marinobacter sp. NSM]|uniref:helix-turn-helix domain-containing protein n=1 Tax=Marinobacter sp. NSM TaxID=3458004 RepID=UPI0040364318
MPMDIVKKFGARLQKIRKNRGLSQEQLAEISGLHRTYISSLERGARNPTLTTIFVIACALDMTVSSLIEGVDDE